MELNKYDYIFATTNQSSYENDLFLEKSLRHFLPNFSTADLLRDDFDKPYIKDNPLYFSLSHSKNLLVIACSSSPIGIDCEFHKIRKFDTIAKRYYTNEEQRYAEGDLANFYKVWCQKEALLKTVGIGIRIDLKSLNSFSYNQGLEFNHKKYTFAPLLTCIDLMDDYSVVVNHTKPLKTI